LREIDTAANKLWVNTVSQMAEAQGITEQLKVEKPLEWVGRMNNIRTCADEIVKKELIYQ